ncbi:hypothetical protein ACD578_07780 [Microvirga sp. RSM25]|uniref:hypothetical protein n=1 Tax=Microvirga sp. RSM25 TaxID=3273802 RepID=UPI0038508681
MDLAELLAAKPAANKAIIPLDIAEMLHALQITQPAAPTGATTSGVVQLGQKRRLLGFADLTMDPALLPDALFFPFEYSEENSGFRLDVNISAAAEALILDTVSPIPSFALKPARRVSIGGGRTLKETLEPAPEIQQIKVKGLKAVLRFAAIDNSLVVTRALLPPLGAADDLLVVTLEPAHFLFGDTGFGFGLNAGLVIDDRLDKAPPSVPGRNSASDILAWRGIAIRDAELFVPPAIPLLGGRAIPISLELGSPSGVDGSIIVNLPGADGRPDITGRVEWHDPAATSLADCLPTLVELVASFQIEGKQSPAYQDEGRNVPGITFAGGKPLRVRARYTRDPVGGSGMRFDLALESESPAGLVSVEVGGAGEKIFVTAATLATALVADRGLPADAGADASGEALHLLLLSASALSSYFENEGSVVIHGVELASEGRTLPVGDQLRLRLDYSIATRVKTFHLGPLQFGMEPNRPMRLRCRNVFLEVNLAESALKMFRLGFDDASLDIEDPGGWKSASPGSLLDIIGVRNGHGSSWVEIDLRCRLDLGPLKISGATVRLTLENGVEPSLRGLDASLDMPGVIDGRGSLRLQPNGFDALLALSIRPLGLRATGEFLQDGSLTALQILTDLPGPVPLANSGLGLFGVGGMFGVNAALKQVPAGAEPVTHYLSLLHDEAPVLRLPEVLEPSKGDTAFGINVRIGTLPDLGVAFLGEGAVMLGVPDFALRAALRGQFSVQLET